MGVQAKHILQQGPVVAAMGRTALAALAQRLDGRGPTGAPETPGPRYNRTIPARPGDLVKDLVRWSGGDPGAWRGEVPHYLFPQWSFPMVTRTLEGISYPLAKVLNAGCRMEVRAPIPAGEPLDLQAQLTDVDDDGRRAILHQRVITGTPSVPEALICDFQALVPLPSKKQHGKKKRKKDRPRVPSGARELAYWKLGPRAGLEFAILTGDFNPVHWIAPYARMSGFKNVILHGFATMALAIEGMNRGLWAGDVHKLRTLEVRFTRPLVLPARVGLYVDGEGGVFVGDAAGGPAYMTGTYTISE